jgi:hypothetical protein
MGPFPAKGLDVGAVGRRPYRSALPLVRGVYGFVRIALRSRGLQALRHAPDRYADPLSERTRRQV